MKSALLGALAVMAALAVLYGKWPGTPRPPLTPESQKLLRCGEVCDRGYSEADWDFARGAARHTKTEPEPHLPKGCLWRCQSGAARKDPERQDPALWAEPFAPAAGFWAYHAAASRCAQERGPLPAADSAGVLSALRRCGVVHLHGWAGPETAALSARLAAAWAELRASEGELQPRLDAHNLRGSGRWEVWVPFREPFNSTQLLASAPLLAALAAYLPGAGGAVLDHVSVINALPGVPVQPLHSDVPEVGKHLELHIPLVPVTAALGPTRFCPCTQGLAADGNAAVSWRFHSPAKLCEAEPGLGYALDAPLGVATLYDAAVVHAGGAMAAAAGERPILQLSFASSREEVRSRGYVDGAFSKGGAPDAAGRALAQAEASSFRAAFGRQGSAAP